MATAAKAGDSTGAINSIRSFMASWVALLRTRIEIVSLELEEQREWMEQMIMMAVAALFCLSLGMLLLTLFVVVLFWEDYRLWVLGGFALFYLGGGVALFLALRKKSKNKPRIFSTSASELAKDHSYLQPGHP